MKRLLLPLARLWPTLRALSRRARLTGLALLLLLATLFEPRWNATRDAYDFLVVLDVTQSMNVADHLLDGKPVSRIAYARQQLRQVLPDLPCGSRIGWAVFTEYRVLVLTAPAEVCANFHDLVATLDRIDGRMAWANASEIYKGTFWALRAITELGGGLGLVFLTDGHESPPLSPEYKPILDGDTSGSGKPYTYLDQTAWQQLPVYEGKAGDIRGLVVGVGGDTALPIPKLDSEGRPLGVWKIHEVMQTDIYSVGRSTGRQPELKEHLSAQRVAHLQQLARDTGLGYHRLADASSLRRALTAAEFAHPVPYRADLRLLFAGLALLLLAAAQLPGRRGAKTKA